MSKEHIEHEEELCQRCGRCCLIKIFYSDLNLWVATNQYCKNFQWVEENGKKLGYCRIYNADPWGALVMPERGVKCISAKMLAEGRLQPNSCPYTKGIPNYRCRVMNL